MSIGRYTLSRSKSDQVMRAVRLFLSLNWMRWREPGLVRRDWSDQPDKDPFQNCRVGTAVLLHEGIWKYQLMLICSNAVLRVDLY